VANAVWFANIYLAKCARFLQRAPGEKNDLIEFLKSL